MSERNRFRRLFIASSLTLAASAAVSNPTPSVTAAAGLAWSSSVATAASAIDGVVNRLPSISGSLSPDTVSASLPTPTLSTTGGTGDVTYAIDPELPSGLSFSTTTGVISGTISSPYGPADHVITATDGDGDKIEISVYFEVTQEQQLEPASQRITMVKGKGFFPNQVPIESYSWSGSTLTIVTEYEHGLETGDVVGLKITEIDFSTSPETRTSEPFNGVYTMTKVDETTLTVEGTQGSGSASDTAVSGGSIFDEWHLQYCNYPGCSLPILWDGVDATYTISPTLPSGVDINPDTGVIYTEYGSSPSTAQDPTSYTITATDSASSATRTSAITIEVLEIETIVAKIDQFFWHPRPLADGRDCDASSVSPPLPGGLTIDEYCNINGQPTELQSPTIHTITPPNGWGDDHTPTPSEVSIEITAAVESPYDIYVQSDPAVDDPTPFVGAGWERYQGVSQFSPAAIMTVNGRTAVTIAGLDGSPVRAALDIGRPGTWTSFDDGFGGQAMEGMSDYCPGMNVAERDALTLGDDVTTVLSFESIDRAPLQFDPSFVEWQWCTRGGYAQYKGAEGEDSVTFILDLTGANPSAYNAMLQIEVDAAGDGFRQGPGDQIFEIDMQPETFQKCSFNPDTEIFSCTSGLTDDVTAFMTDSDLDYVFLDPVPTCASTEGTQPCVDDITEGWALRLKDTYAELAGFDFGGFEGDDEHGGGVPHGVELIPYPTTAPFKVYDGDQVEFTVNLPSGEARGRSWGTDPTTGASIAESGAKFDTYSYAQDANLTTVTSGLTARAGTWVFSTGDAAGEFDYNDSCSNNLEVVAGVTYTDLNQNGEYDSGEEAVPGCQNTPGTIATTSILLAPGVGTVETAEAHGFAIGDQVTICCVGTPFDGTHQVYFVPSETSFTISTAGLLDQYSGQDLSTADWHGNEFRIRGFVAPGDVLNVPNTQVNMSISLTAPFADEEVLAGAFVTTNAQAKAFGDSIMAGEAFDFGVAGPSYDAEGNYRNDGFFQICMPEPAIEEWFGFDLATAVSEMQITRNGSLISTGLTSSAATCGSSPGLSVQLDPFSFSAPYFRAAPDQVSAGFGELEPYRLLDTRKGDNPTKIGELDGTGDAYELTVLGEGGVPSTGVSAVALNVTVVDGEANDYGGYVSVYPCGTLPDVSNLNFVTGQTVPNSVITPVDENGKVCFYVYGKAHLLADVSGYFGG